jgi:formylglycine-generating enzyme required for sulfatase activity
MKPMPSQPVRPSPSRGKADTWAVLFPREAVLIGESTVIQEAEAYFSTNVREMDLRTIPADEDRENELPPGFPLLRPWCLICDLVTSHKSLRIARKILLNTTNVPFFAIVNEASDLGESELRGLLELGITHVLPLPASWAEAWAEIKKILTRRLNPLLSVHSTKMWLVGVLQSVATEERDCTVRISSRSQGRNSSRSRDHGTSLRISPVGLLGEIYFRGGQPIYAWSTRLQGDEAVIDLLQTSNVQISVLDSSWVPPARNVHSPLQGVLLEFMRRKDLGQLEPPSSAINPVEPGELERGSDGVLPVPAHESRSRSFAQKARRAWPLWGAVAVLLLTLALVIGLKTPGSSASPGAAVPSKPEAAPPQAPVSVAAPAPPAPPKPPAEEAEPPATRKPTTPRELALALTDRVPLDLVLIPAGRFIMGTPDDEWGREPTEGPAHDVVIPSAFYMSPFETTQEQYEAVMGQNPSQFKGPRRPVDTVSSFDAQEFCERATKRVGREVRLPTEAEWEYACRAGSKTPFHSGSALKSSEANIDGRATEGNYRGMTVDVGSFPPNAFGLYDMHGNVGEWCLDYFDSRAYDAPSRGPVAFSPSRPARVWRGGAYNDPPRRCRSGAREQFNPGGKDSFRGFRVVVPLETTPQPVEQPDSKVNK